MKVLVISPKFHPVIGGGETFVLNSIKQLHEAGIDVSIAVEPHPKRTVDTYPFTVHEVAGLSDNNMDIIVATKNLAALIADERPDVIHVHGYFALLVVGFCNLTHIPVIVSVHSTPVWGERIVGGMGSFDVELNFARQALAVGQPQVVTAANDVYAHAAQKIAQDTCPVAVLPYPVDTGFFCYQQNTALRKTYGLHRDDVLVMVPSRIIERKGIKEAVLALEHLPHNYYLCIPGAYEPLDAAYWQSIQSHPVYAQVKDRIIIPSAKLLYDEMPGLYGASDIIAMPSYYEGAPVATVEAMASGKPFVGADSQGINGFIRHGENGLLVPQKTVKELADAIHQLATQKMQSGAFAKQARQDIMHLSWEAQLPQLIQLYQNHTQTDIRKAPQPERLYAVA